MKRSSTLGWIALALAGLAVSAGASLAASRLAGQRIGLDSEPIQAGDRLAPRRAGRTEDRPEAVRRPAAKQRTPTTTTTGSSPVYPPPSTSGPSSGSRSTTTGAGGEESSRQGERDSDD